MCLCVCGGLCLDVEMMEQGKRERDTENREGERFLCILINLAYLIECPYGKSFKASLS